MLYSQSGIDTDPVYHWTAPADDMFQFEIATTGTQSLVSLNLQAANAQGGSNSFLLIAIVAIIAVVVVVVVLIFVMRSKNRSKTPSQPYQQPMYQQAPVQPAPPIPPTLQSNMCPTCGQPLRWIAEYQRWYCDREQKYV